MGRNWAVVMLITFVGLSLSLACPEEYPERVEQNYRACMHLYDRESRQKPVLSDRQIDAVLATLPKKRFHQLDPAYVEHAQLNREFVTKSKRTGHRSTRHYRHKRFYEIKGKDQFKYLVGHFRVVDFLPNTKSPGYEYDPFHEAARELACTDEASQHRQYLLIDTRLLKKLRLLIQLLKTHPAGYDHTAFSIYYGFRHPHMNDVIEGAKSSQHLWGKALDIRVGDINRDGHSNREDKAIVLHLLERKVIGRSGGIGRYPDSETEIHMDVRGWYARWDAH